jgi:hypothetical protein
LISPGISNFKRLDLRGTAAGRRGSPRTPQAPRLSRSLSRWTPADHWRPVGRLRTGAAL